MRSNLCMDAQSLESEARRAYRLRLLEELCARAGARDQAADARLRRLVRAIAPDLPPSGLLRVARCVLKEYEKV